MDVPWRRKKLQEADIHSKQEILKIGVAGLIEVPGIGKKTAEKIVDIVKKAEPKPKKEIKPNLKKLIPKKITRKKEPRDTDSKSKISRLKGGLTKISKLKKVIPSRGTKEKENTETEE